MEWFIRGIRFLLLQDESCQAKIANPSLKKPLIQIFSHEAIII